MKLLSTLCRRAVLPALLLTLAATSQANDRQEQLAVPPTVDVVIALDVSGSMSGLIDSAKQRLWDIVNELGRAQPQPRLRIAILSFGRPSYGADSGFVRVDLPFTTNLDTVNETLFSYRTDGGDEYVARAITTAVRKLQWEAQSMRVLFVAGNEAATQDPQVSTSQAVASAAASGIVVNTIYCGNDNDNDAAGWRSVAQGTNGLYASINQNAAAVANVTTPMDKELTLLNQALNETYMAYGDAGARARENQRQQDANAATMSEAALSGRVVAKASALYDSADWDLVDAVRAGKKLEEIAEAELPEPLLELSPEQRSEYVQAQAAKRQDLQARIRELGEKRRDHIAAERERLESETGLDDAIVLGLRQLAERSGFDFGGE